MAYYGSTRGEGFGRVRTLLRAGAALLLVLTLPGCAPDTPLYVEDGASYDADSVIRLLETSDSGDLKGEPVSRAAQLRQEALARLRKRGGSAAEAAATLTRVFTSDTVGVPYYVESARFNGTPSWVVLEASGRRTGSLLDRRLWVLDRDGQVLLFSAR